VEVHSGKGFRRTSARLLAYLMTTSLNIKHLVTFMEVIRGLGLRHQAEVAMV
jgi:hypothetical protein